MIAFSVSPAFGCPGLLAPGRGSARRAGGAVGQLGRGIVGWIETMERGLSVDVEDALEHSG